MADTIRVIESSLTTPKVRIITIDRPWEWLGAGWKDLWQAPAASIPYGLIFMIMGYVLVYLVEAQFHYALALTTGFLLAGPFLAMGLYDISRRLQMGESATLGHALTAWRHNTIPILLFGITIGLLMIIWARLSAVLFGVIVTSQNMTLSSTVSQLFFSGSGLTFLLIFTGVGAVIAAVVFAISVVAIPMMLDRKIDFITAVLSSLAAVRANPAPMALWAALIVIFTGIGLLSFYIGLVIALPLIGHATWHAYQELVDNHAIEQQPA
ncbi:MAG: DUF2189 domain-containing protein [Gammaproteobacteria bacterium]|nr:DUF2189 domain-containing protein [Gammaproteobacteria bacterium]MCP5196729.1 DUF2189 domain-containing protein [Gammaproteobacteria bacterium]